MKDTCDRCSCENSQKFRDEAEELLWRTAGDRREFEDLGLIHRKAEVRCPEIEPEQRQVHREEREREERERRTAASPD